MTGIERRWRATASVVVFVVLAVSLSPLAPGVPAAALIAGGSEALDLRVPSDFFTENAGQVGNPEILYYARGGGVSVGFAPGAVLVHLREPPPRDDPHPRSGLASPVPSATLPPLRGHLVRIAFEGANPVLPQARGELPHRANFFLGDDPARWRTGVRNYAEIVYEDAWDGIDVVYRTSPGGVKYDLVVRPGADLADVAFAYEGVTDLAVTSRGLTAATSLGPLRDDLPAAWQASGRPVDCALRRIAERTAGYACSGWDGTGELIIDPLLYSTFLGGGFYDRGYGIAVDASGAAYVTGFTGDAPTDFPVMPGAYDTTHNGWDDAFVAKLDASGSALLYSTFLGGSDDDWGSGIAVDASGAAYVTGGTDSADFPATPGAYDTTHNGLSDAFLAKLNPSGSGLLYSTFLGGSGSDQGSGIAVDASGAVYVTGYTSVTDFPATPGAYDTTHNGGRDVFVAKLDASGSDLLYSTFLGGGFDDGGSGIAVDDSGEAYLTGFTEEAATDFPATPGAFDTTYNGGTRDAFVAKLDASGSALLYSTFLGGSSDDVGTGIAVDASGATYVTGYTFDGVADFPATPGAYDTTHNGEYDAFAAKLDASGSSLRCSTFLGGSWHDGGYGIAVDASGAAYVTGYAARHVTDFPTTPGAYDATHNGLDDTFVAMLDLASRPVLSATDEPNYGTDGLDPEAGTAGVTPFVYRVNYANADNDAPAAGDPKVHIRKGGVEVAGSPFPMNAVDSADTTYTDGKLYTFTTTLAPRGTDYTYDFTANDAAGFAAADWPAPPADAPDVLNLAATADAGPDQPGLFRNALVSLDGTRSTDPDGDMLTYSWTQTAGLTVALTGATTATPSFTPTAAGTYVFELTVDDSFGGTDVDEVTVTVVNRPPTADAGGPYACPAGGSVTLNGTGSTDPDGDALTYAWTVDLTSPVTLSGLTPTFLCPTTGGAVTVTLAVTDPGGLSNTDDTSLSIRQGVAVADWAWPLLVLLAVIALLLVLFLLFRRKKREGETTDAPPAGPSTPPKGP